MISDNHLTETRRWISFFRDVWVSNAPTRLHTRDLDMAGNPEMHPEFLHWLDGTTGRHEGTEDRRRLKRAIKRLRERSLREYEVFYRVVSLGQTITEVTEWLNERAIRGGHPERYRLRDTTVILYAAVDKVYSWY